MSNSTFVVALRLVGIWIVLTWGYQTLNAILTAAYLEGSQTNTVAFGLFSLRSATWLVFGFALLFRSVALGQLLVPGGVRGGGPMPWSPADALLVALRVFGVYLIATALTSQDLWNVVLIDFLELGRNSRTHIAVRVAPTIAKIIIGTWLLFGARGLVNLFDSVRLVSKSQATENNEN